MRIECPVCCFGLRGSQDEGYRCVQCHARYSHAFVRSLRRQQFSELIQSHFSAGSRNRAPEAQVTILPAADTSGIAEIEEIVRQRPERLEDVLDFPQSHGPELDLRKNPVQDLMQKRKAQYDPTSHRP